MTAHPDARATAPNHTRATVALARERAAAAPHPGRVAVAPRLGRTTATVPRSGVVAAVPRFGGVVAAAPRSKERVTVGAQGTRRRPRGLEVGERQRHSQGGQASGDNAPNAGEQRRRTPKPEQRHHTITYERWWFSPMCEQRRCRTRREDRATSIVRETVAPDILRSGAVRAPQVMTSFRSCVLDGVLWRLPPPISVMPSIIVFYAYHIHYLR